MVAPKEKAITHCMHCFRCSAGRGAKDPQVFVYLGYSEFQQVFRSGYIWKFAEHGYRCTVCRGTVVSNIRLHDQSVPNNP